MINLQSGVTRHSIKFKIDLFYILKWQKTVVGLIKTYFLSPSTYRV